MTHYHVAFGISGYGPDGADGYPTAGTRVNPADVVGDEDDEGGTELSDADILREIGMDDEADDLDEHLGGNF